MKVDDKLKLINRWPTEEVLTEPDLRKLLEAGVKLNHYFGIEVSGRLHIGQGIGMVQKIADLQKAGVKCSIFLPDWHTWINNKLGGDWANIQKGSEYIKEILTAGLKCVGGDPEKVTFIKGSDVYNNDFWRTTIEVCKNMSLSRALRSITIMGRNEKDLANFAQLLYPPMQAADIFFMRFNLAHGGMDQRKIHVIARDVADKISCPFKSPKLGFYKPIALHTHLWLGLQKPSVWPVPKDADKTAIKISMKMSKSKPKTCIFLTDTPDDIREKINNAFCPEREVEFNPLIDWAHSIAFLDGPLRINRPEKFGGELVIDSYESLCRIYSEGKLHPMDLKNVMAELLIKLTEPARKHMKNKMHLVKMIESFRG
ncbi:MAG: tyrosine--tRNA ligase [Candidatus Nanoarchaeia archaeon]|jgi:tyrosyl-tRNA synthetase